MKENGCPETDSHFRPSLVLESVIAGDADPGDHLRRRRREVALDNNIILKRAGILDDKPTRTLRLTYDVRFWL
jgi:hypothetical protein